MHYMDLDQHVPHNPTPTRDLPHLPMFFMSVLIEGTSLVSIIKLAVPNVGVEGFQRSAYGRLAVLSGG